MNTYINQYIYIVCVYVVRAHLKTSRRTKDKIGQIHTGQESGFCKYINHSADGDAGKELTAECVIKNQALN